MLNTFMSAVSMRLASRLIIWFGTAALVMVCGARDAGAAIVVTIDRATFAAQFGLVGADHFAGLPGGVPLASPLARSAGGLAYQARAIDPATGPGDLFGLDDGGGGTWLSTNYASAHLLLSGFQAPVRGIGGNFFSTDFFGGRSAGELTLHLLDSNGSFDYLLPASGGFIGLISDALILSLSVSASQGGAEQFATAGEVVLGVVPEPAAALLFGLGALALAGSRAARRPR